MKDLTFNNPLLGKRSLFWTPDYLDNSAWMEHIPFGFWIVEVLQPKMMVELGVHNGTSYFAFCQAVKQLALDAVCYGVDTWQGDEHTGFYDEATFTKVSEYNQDQYAGFSTLIRSTFEEAVDYFIDGTVDLLHIDGLHTYEAVKHDFETWLPKLSANAFVLFHDINVRERNFGVFKFWEELQQSYNTFQFNFGFGLGVLSLGKHSVHELDLLLNVASDKSYAAFLRNLFSNRGHAIKAYFAIKQALHAEREGLKAQKSSFIHFQDAYKVLEEKHVQLQSAFDALRESYQQVKENNGHFKLLKIKVEESQQLLAEIGHKEDSIIQNTDSLSAIIKDMLLKSEKNEKLIAEKKALQDELDWYKRTYENRSILGLLKSRLIK